MSAEPLRLSREKKRAFRAGNFPEDIITKDMIREMTFSIECSPGTPNPREFKVTEGMLFVKVPRFMSPPIEYCDHLMKINDKPIKTKKELLMTVYQLSQTGKQHFLEIRIRRIISVERVSDQSLLPSNAAFHLPPLKVPTHQEKPRTGYSYYKIILIYFPRSKLGISVKSYQKVVYVESTDSSWGSTTRRFLYLGDAILKVDGTEITSLQSLQTALRNGFQTNGIITLVVERAVDRMSVQYVQSVIEYSKKTEPTIPTDVIDLCKKQLEVYMTSGFQEPKSIFRGPPPPNAKPVQRQITLVEKVNVSTIHSEHRNPMTMQKVPDFQKIVPETEEKKE